MAQHDVKTMSKCGAAKHGTISTTAFVRFGPKIKLFFEKLLLMGTNESYGNYITSYPSESNPANRLGETAKTINKTQFN